MILQVGLVSWISSIAASSSRDTEGHHPFMKVTRITPEKATCTSRAGQAGGGSFQEKKL